MKFAAMLRPFMAAMAAFFFSVSAFAQALPSTTPPLADSWTAANDTKYGRTGTDPDAVFGRDRMYRGTTPANDATFTRRGRSAVPKAALGSALAKFARKFGPIGTATAFLELAQDINATWRANDDGTHDLIVLRGDMQCRVQAGNGVWSSNHATCGAAANEVKHYYAQPPAVDCSPSSCTINGYPLTVQVSYGSPTLSPMSESEISDAILSNPLLPKISGEVDQSPLHDSLPANDAARIPWAPEVVVLPEPINLPPTTATNPDGSITVTNRRLEPSSSATGPIFWTPVDTTTTTMPDGSVKTGTNQGGPQTSPQPAPFEMPCGVAGKAPCAVKVDEAGTAVTVPSINSPESVAAEITKPYENLKNNPAGFWPSLPSVNWTFSLPTSCGPISVPAFSPYLESIDVCQFQGIFHDLMSLVWVIGGLFGAVGTFWRNVFAGA